ncbi:TPA: LamB/YcsF family protein [Burkholderia cepacia ATCC 25416]|nr:LamB/YcsF family protein [Burkholderia cepacia ATCC 25416]HDV6365808.1 LamB/YcsF family protein [Burkholderia cepacia]
MRLDLNADVGEGYGPWRLGDDLALLPVLSSVNVACGYHAGDAEIMARTVNAANAAGVDIGAHIGLPDRIGFGRRRIAIDGERFASHALYQFGALHALAVAAGSRVTHASFHGALGDMACEDEALAMSLVGAIAAFDHRVVICTAPGTMIMRAARRHGLDSIGIFSADRGYAADGQLLSRRQAGAVLRDPDDVARRMHRFIADGVVDTIDGRSIPMPARTVMIHGDTPNAVEIARAIRDAVQAAGGSIVPISRLNASTRGGLHDV